MVRQGVTGSDWARTGEARQDRHGEAGKGQAGAGETRRVKAGVTRNGKDRHDGEGLRVDWNGRHAKNR
jgi:hypothetical protein